LPLLLVGVDPLAAAGDDVLHPEQVRQQLVQLGLAALADVPAARPVVGVDEPAGLALLRRRQRERAPLARVCGRDDDALDLVAGALVVDQRAWLELADGQEPGP
jgi:hypothetical protein